MNEEDTLPKSILQSPFKPNILSPLKINVYIDMIDILPEKMKPLSYQESVLRASGKASLGRNMCEMAAGTAGGGHGFFFFF